MGSKTKEKEARACVLTRNVTLVLERAKLIIERNGGTRFDSKKVKFKFKLKSRS